MQGNSPFKKIVKVSLFIYFLGNIIFGALAFLNYSLVVGFAVGGAVNLMGYFLRILLIKKFLKTVRSKRKGFWFGWGQMWLILIFHFVMVLLVIIIDNVANGHRIFHGGIKSVLKPINMITYMVGISVVPLGTISSLIVKKRR